MRKIFGAAISGAVVVTALGVLAIPAQASSMWGCNYPRVCLYDGSYNGGRFFASYQDTYYQNIPSSGQNRADAAVNTRNDDSVWLLDTGASPDAYICIPRNTAVNLGDYAHPNGGTWANDVDTVRVWSDDGRCSGTFQVQQGRVSDGWRR